jgi:hypothetical protein|tara:strand:- start:1684 stop:1896 length:213 start_codon:yes stop_codon:yes gene_type:complete
MENTKVEYEKSLMYIAGMLSDCQEMLSPEFNDEDGWVAPSNAKMAINIMNNAKKIMFEKMKEDENERGFR